MKQIIRAIGYTGALQTMTMPVGYKGNVTAYLWGGGGGGGGNDSHPGGSGGGSGFSRITFEVQSGQVITVAVGGGGGGGLSGRSAGGGGAAGGSYTGVIFNTRYPPAGPAAVEAVTWRDWRSGFMNATWCEEIEASMYMTVRVEEEDMKEYVKTWQSTRRKVYHLPKSYLTIKQTLV